MGYCNYNTLHHCRAGYVLECEFCGEYHVAFGTTMLNLRNDEYQGLRDYLWWELNFNTATESERKFKNIQVPTSTSKITLLFTLEEVEQLYDMLQQALLSKQVQQCLYNHN